MNKYSAVQWSPGGTTRGPHALTRGLKCAGTVPHLKISTLTTDCNDGILFKSAFYRKSEMPFTVSCQLSELCSMLVCISVILLLCVFFSLYIIVCSRSVTLPDLANINGYLQPVCYQQQFNNSLVLKCYCKFVMCRLCWSLIIHRHE